MQPLIHLLIYLTTQCSYCFQIFRACVQYHRQYLCKVSMISIEIQRFKVSIENKWNYMHCRDRKVFIKQFGHFQAFLKNDKISKIHHKTKSFYLRLMKFEVRNIVRLKNNISKNHKFSMKTFWAISLWTCAVKKGHTVLLSVLLNDKHDD